MEIGKKYLVKIPSVMEILPASSVCVFETTFSNVKYFVIDNTFINVDGEEITLNYDTDSNQIDISYRVNGVSQSVTLNDSSTFLPVIFVGQLREVIETGVEQFYDDEWLSTLTYQSVNDIFILYQLDHSKNVVTKSDNTFVDIIGGSYKEQIDVSNPSIMIQYNEMPTFNYVYIPSLKRYYFVTRVVCVRNNLYQIDLHVDVLYSFDADIRSQSGLISRNANTYDTSLVDTRLPLSNVPTITTSPLNYNVVPNIINSNLSKTDYSVVVYILGSGSLENTSSTNAGSNVTNLPIVSRITGKNPIANGFIMTYEKYQVLCAYLYSHQNYVSYILSAIAFPYTLANETEQSEETGITIDGQLVTTGYLISGETSKYHNYITHTFTKRYSGTKDFLNYEPYTKYEIYLMYYGWFTLNARDVVGKTITIYYVDDFTTGVTQIIIYNKTNNAILHTLQAQLGCKLSVSSTNADELERQRQSSFLNLTLGLISGAVSTGVGLSTGNPLGVIGGILSASKSIASAVNSEIMRVDRASTGVSGDKLGLYTPNKPMLRITSYEPLTIDTTRYKSLQGYPLNTYGSLSSYTGYTEVGEMKYIPSNLGYITNNEMDEIETLARNGIIL